MPDIPKEISQLAAWWAQQIKDKAGSDLDPDTVTKFEQELAEVLSENLGDPFSVSLFYTDTVPPALIRAARRAKLGPVKPYLTSHLLSRAQPREVMVQIGYRASCRNIFKP